MSIRRTKQTSDTEKRFQQLQQQIYGKQNISLSSENTKKSTYSFDSNTKIAVSSSNVEISDVAYLKKDLAKIFILSGLAIGIEFLLFFLNQNHYINLNFLNLKI